MAKTWYPVIDYITCEECGTCIAHCESKRHFVYNSEKAPCPVVLRPENCIDHCHGCGEKCPVGAITYVGDDTGWTPPLKKCQEPPEPCCSCSDGESRYKKLLIEYLYLDLNTCHRCIGTDAVLDEVMATLTPSLELAGFTVEYKKTEINSAEMAVQYRFLSSPTIRINGQDICKSVVESSCGCCSDISGAEVECRVFEYEGKSYEVPPKAMLAEAVLKTAFTKNTDCSRANYELPENIKHFFAGKATKASECSCGGNCC